MPLRYLSLLLPTQQYGVAFLATQLQIALLEHCGRLSREEAKGNYFHLCRRSVADLEDQE